MKTARVLLCLFLLVPSAHAAIVINEIFYAPPDKTVHEEFLELFNTGTEPVDLSGWYFDKGISYVIPEGVSLEGGAYLLIAQNPEVLISRYGGLPALGPFEGRFDNDGEEIELRDSDGLLVDRVDYQCGFPWPTIDKTTGNSMELVNPAFDNELGGNWRSSDPGLQSTSTFVQKKSTWRYRKGTSPASSPQQAWTELDFSLDGTWQTGRAAFGYGQGDVVVTELDDMRNSYSSIFLRTTFEIDDIIAVGGLTLRVQYDDGFNAWINGRYVAGDNVASDADYDDTADSAIENVDFNDFELPTPVQDYCVEGTNVLAIQLFNASLSGSSDAFIDASLRKTSGPGAGPTPAARNAMYADEIAPCVRHLSCRPDRTESADATSPYPVTGEPMLVSIKATDATAVAAVELSYQVVEPGAYIELTDPAYSTQWTTIAMNDAGEDGDPTAGDSVYTVRLPGALQQHRRLIRYRLRAVDDLGNDITVPYTDDPQPNFAYFVYDGIPYWEGAIDAESSNASFREQVRYSPETMASVPCYFLITKRSSCEDATWYSKYGGSDYLWTGTMVYDGVVYDHINYRARGGVWRYSMGKNMWKFDFLRSHYFQARTPYGKKYDTTWDKLNFSAIIQQGNYLHRGEQGLFEAVGFTLFNLAGVEAPKVHYVTFRIIDEAEEFGPTQYDGDFWGLYLVLEQMDGRFLDEHSLPDGNLYKMEGGSGELNNLGVNGVTDKSDLNSFMNTYENSPSESWWENNVNLTSYYSYRSIVEAIHHYDIGYGKNYFYYLNPETNIWTVLPWDLDLTWADNMYGNGNEPFKSRVLPRTWFGLAYKNRCREILDLLYNTGQTGEMIDEFAAMVNEPGSGATLVDADRAMWDYNPVMVDSSLVNLNKAGHGRFYQQAASRTFEGMMQLMKNYIISRGNWIKSSIIADSSIPDTPQVTSTGSEAFAADALSFSVSDFSDPQGDNSFGSMEWRIGEVALSSAPPFDPASPRPYEINAVWESGELPYFEQDLELTPWLLKIGHRYRLRARFMDNTNRWSHWSPPIEFTVSEPAVPFPQTAALRITEIMYNPENGADYEFIELTNIGAEPVDLTPVSFSDGIDFSFAASDVQELAPGQYVVLVNERKAFESYYDTSSILIAGEYKKALDNSGERIELLCGANTPIQAFTYQSSWHAGTNGLGWSLTCADPAAPEQLWNQADGWKPSSEKGGTPGLPDGGSAVGGWQLPSDFNQDGIVDLSDAISLLLFLFTSDMVSLPCEGGVTETGGNRLLLDANNDTAVDLADVVYLLAYLFNHGDAPAQGTSCILIENCPNACY